MILGLRISPANDPFHGPGPYGTTKRAAVRTTLQLGPREPDRFGGFIVVNQGVYPLN